MTWADAGRFALVIGLGIVGFTAFLVAGTLLGLMLVDPTGCRCFAYYPPVGLYALGILGVLFLVSTIYAAVNDVPPVVSSLRSWGLSNVSVIIMAIIAALVFYYIFWWQARG